MKFWIVTPSYNQVKWLNTCLKSVADQTKEGICVHHHIQDACSTDGTIELLREWQEHIKISKNYTFSFSSEKDNGMYDAINIGWRKADDDVDFIAHLNCDEQYMPNALINIADTFRKHADTDVLLADMLVVDEAGEYICHRRSLKPYRFLSQLWCAGFTASTFQRASVIKDKKVFFDTDWKNIGDKVWYNSLHKAGVKFTVYHEIVAIFTDTGDNLNWTDEGKEESIKYINEFVPMLKGNLKLLQILSKINALRRLTIEFFCKVPTQYSIFCKDSDSRTTKPIESPTWRWGKKAWNNI